MKKIQLLSEALINQIAAGEVVERPASVVKELLENSIDSGADSIFLELEEGGLKLIRVMDNGSGIPNSEIHLALERHATSKIQALEDLEDLSSLGFRGEALASIASVAHVILASRTEKDATGQEIEVRASQQFARRELAMPVGTDISVLGLFQATPARRKYMKTPKTEYTACLDWLIQIALSYPALGFKLKRDGQPIFDLPKGQTLLDRIASLFGEPVRNALIPVHYEDPYVQITGYIGKPELARRQQKQQFFFVNGRSIQSRLMRRAVMDGYHSLLMHEQNPWFLLDISMSAQELDVNVHPRKLEVKFAHESEIYRAVLKAVSQSLEAQVLSPNWEEPYQSAHNPRTSPTPSTQASLDLYSIPNRVGPAFQIPDTAQRKPRTLHELKLKPLAQFARSYILAESLDGLVLVDQHAAHERVRYERLMQAMEAKKPLVQKLLTPLELDLGKQGYETAISLTQDLQELGFELEPFGGTTLLLRSVPDGLQNRNPEACFQELLEELSGLQKGTAVSRIRESILTYTACRGAIKFGDSLTLPEMEVLLRDMEACIHGAHCPHGRPAIVTFAFEELETLFKRRNF